MPGCGGSIFYLFSIPALGGGLALRRTVDWLHVNGAHALLIVAGLHALAALFHHYVRRDGVLRRMLPLRGGARG